MGTSSMYSGPKDNKLLPDDYIGDNKEGEKEDLATMREYDPNEDYDDVED